MRIVSATFLLAGLAEADPLWKLFSEFKRKYDVEFAHHAEDVHRFGVFKQNMERAAALTKKSGGKTQFGPTKFSHLTPEEFKKTYLGYKKTEKGEQIKKTHKKRVFPKRSVTAGSKDWRGSNAVTPVKDQGQCGSCWAFSATQAVETAYWKSTGGQRILAPQQTTSCDDVDYGCNGGNTETAYDYMRQAGGVELEADYPYTSGTTERTGSCKANPSEFSVKVGDTTTISNAAWGESDMLQAIQESPISICVDAEPWQWYMGGVIDASTCGTQLDHCVHLVGYKAGGDYWIVKNSWNTNWGEDGYIRVKQGENACGVALDATIVSAEPEAVRDIPTPEDGVKFLQGLATGLGLANVAPCATASDSFAAKVDAAITLILKKDPEDMIQGLMALALAVQSDLPAAAKECKATAEDLEKLITSLNILKDPKAFMYKVEMDLMINGISIHEHVNNAMGEYKKGDYLGAGTDIGQALEELLVGKPAKDLYQ